MGRHQQTLIYYDFAAKLWAKGFSESVIADAVLDKYGINLTSFGNLCSKYRKDFPHRTKEQNDLNRSMGGRFSSVNREQRRKLVEKALLSGLEDR